MLLAKRCLCFWDGGNIVISGCSGRKRYVGNVPEISEYASNRNVAVALSGVGDLGSNRYCKNF